MAISDILYDKDVLNTVDMMSISRWSLGTIAVSFQTADTSFRTADTSIREADTSFRTTTRLSERQTRHIAPRNSEQKTHNIEQLTRHNTHMYYDERQTSNGGGWTCHIERQARHFEQQLRHFEQQARHFERPAFFFFIRRLKKQQHFVSDSWKENMFDYWSSKSGSKN